MQKFAHTLQTFYLRRWNLGGTCLHMRCRPSISVDETLAVLVCTYVADLLSPSMKPWRCLFAHTLQTFYLRQWNLGGTRLSWVIVKSYLEEPCWWSCQKCSRSIGILHKVKQFLPKSALLSLYYTLFLSHINSGITGWSSANSVDKDRLHVLQKRALRAVNNSECRSHSYPLFIKYNQLKISHLCNIFLVYSCINIVITCYHPCLITRLKLMLKTMIIILEMHSILNILITNLTFVTNIFATRVLK